MRAPLLALLIPCAILAACEKRDASVADADTAPPAPTTEPTAPPPVNSNMAVAMLAGLKDSTVRGELRLVATAAGVNLSGEISGLTPGTEHGFHIHEHGDCSAPDGASAGAHLNPANAAHGGPDATPRHLGDLPNVKSNEEGRAEVNTTIAGATLRDGGANNLVGKSFIVHARRDDYKTQPSGDSGDRIACGLIQ
jgi:Cu-Zn family superoxide dismutase